MAKAQTSSTEINFTKAAIGKGDVPSGTNIVTLTALVDQVKTLPIAGLAVANQQAQIKVQMTNVDVSADFKWKEIGIFATDPDEGEILYLYGNAGDDADTIQAYSAGADEFLFTIIAKIANEVSTKAVIDKGLLYITQSERGISGGVANQDDLTAHTSAENPHSGSAPLVSPALTGTPTAPTAERGTNTKQIATTAFVDNAKTEVQATIDYLSGKAIQSATFGGTAVPQDGIKLEIPFPTAAQVGALPIIEHGETETDANTLYAPGIHKCKNWLNLPSWAISTQGTIIVYDYNSYSDADGTAENWISQTFIDVFQTLSGLRIHAGTEWRDWSKTAGLTATDVGASNPNLLINGDFRVNQRGVNQSTAVSYSTVDRWRNDTDANITTKVTRYSIGAQMNAETASNYAMELYIQAVSADAYSNLIQELEDDSNGYSPYCGKKLTYSAGVNCTSDYRAICIGYKRLSDSTLQTVATPIPANSPGIYSCSVTLPYDACSVIVGVICHRYITSADVGTVTDFWNAKLELGSVATPFSPRPYAEEYTLCRRYFRRNFHCAIANYQTTDTGILHILLCPPMRIAPSLVILDSLDGFIETQWGGNVTPTNLRIAEGDTSGVILEFDNGETGAVFGVKSDAIGLDSEIY